jgi:hypothetical protein
MSWKTDVRKRNTQHFAELRRTEKIRHWWVVAKEGKKSERPLARRNYRRLVRKYPELARRNGFDTVFRSRRVWGEKANPGVCAAVDCALRAKAKYCSKQCSARTRNRCYFATVNGRMNKRAGLRRYFQAHKAEVYEKRAARMTGYVKVLIECGRASEYMGRLQSRRDDLEPHEYTMLHAKHLSRVQHDWHPESLGDTPVGRPLYGLDPDTGKMRPGWYSPGRGWEAA